MAVVQVQCSDYYGFHDEPLKNWVRVVFFNNGILDVEWFLCVCFKVGLWGRVAKTPWDITCIESGPHHAGSSLYAFGCKVKVVRYSYTYELAWIFR